MTVDSVFVRFLVRVYSVLLYAWPREFRLAYGGEIKQVFRDRCRYVKRTGDGHTKLLHFAMMTAADWMSTTFRERGESLRQAIAAARKPVARGSVAEWSMTILIYLFATTTLVQAYVIPTGSMEGNLRVGDHMLVDKLTYAKPLPGARHLLPYRDIERGDIVAFTYPEDTHQTFVKRVIGLPGDRIHMENQQVYRNGSRLIEPYTQHIAAGPDTYRDDFPTQPEMLTTPKGRDMFAHHISHGDVVVPPDTLFVLGDNRDNSLDSRYWGFVPRDYVVGKPVVVYWSYDAPTEDLENWNAHHLIDVAEHFFTKTRWNRMFLVPRSQQAEEIRVN
jgi:signal peptidase I